MTPKKEKILAYIQNYEKQYGVCPSYGIVSEALGMKLQTVGYYMRKFREAGVISKSRKRKPPEPKSSSTGARRVFVTLDEVSRTKRKIQVGDTVLIKNHRTRTSDEQDGRAVRAKVLSKHRNLVCLSNRLSCTYVQLAIWMRNRRKAIE